MPARKLFLLVLALMIAAGTAILARSMMSGAPGQGVAVTGQPVVSVQEVMVAARDLPAGTLIKETDLKWQPWPTDTSAGGFAIKGKAAMTDYTGAVVRQGLRAGEPIMAGRIVRKNEQGFMAAVLNAGMRAVSVPVTPAGGVAGFVFPGDYVDVIVTHQVARKTDQDPSGHKVSETVLSNVRVLALDQRTDDQATEPKVAQTATLEVTPKQAETLVLVTHIGTLSLALRSLASGPDEPPGINLESLDTIKRAVANDKEASPDESVTWDSDISGVLTKPGNRRGAVQHIQIMRGKDKSETVFELRQ